MKHILCLWFLCFCSFAGHTQILRVLDARTHEPIEGVTLFNQNINSILITDKDGRVDVSELERVGEVIVEHIGYTSQTGDYAIWQEEGFLILLEPSSIQLDDLVVSASRWDQSSVQSPAKIVSIQTKTKELQNPQTAADLLGITGKVFIQKSQQGGGSPMIRGFATNRLIYTIDGVRMNTAIFRAGNIQNVINLDPFATERTEVVFGPGSVLYGSDAIGGTMGFYTLRPQLSSDDKTNVTGQAVARYSSANHEKTGHFHVNVGWKKWALVSSISSWSFDHLRQGSKGPSDYIKPIYTARIDGRDQIITQSDPLLQIPSAYDQFNVMQKIRFSPNENWDIQYAFHYSETSPYGRYDRHNRYRNGTLRYAEWDYGKQTWDMHLFSIQHEKSNLIYDKSALKLAKQTFGESRIDRSLNSDTRNTQTESVTAWSANLDFVKKLGAKNELFYGTEYVFNDVTSLGNLSNILSGEATEGPARYPNAGWGSFGVYVQDVFRINEKMTLQAGARYNSLSIDADFQNNLAFYPLPFDKANIQNGALTGSLGMVWRPSKQWIVRANLGTAFRSPNVDDLGKFFDSEPGTITVPNANLKPEYAYNADAGITRVFGKYVKVDVNAFYTRLENALVRRNFSFNGLDSLIYDGELSRVQAIQNAAKANVYGIEAGIEITLPSGFGLSSDINYQIGEEELDDGTLSPSRHAAPVFGVTRLSYSAGKLFWQLYAQYQAERTHDDLPSEEQGKTEIYAKDTEGNTFAPAWYTLNFKAMYTLDKHVSFTAGVENITDQRYRPYSSGISGAGRNFVLSASVKF